MPPGQMFLVVVVSLLAAGDAAWAQGPDVPRYPVSVAVFQSLHTKTCHADPALRASVVALFHEHNQHSGVCASSKMVALWSLTPNPEGHSTC